jgi:hypothetical protein
MSRVHDWGQRLTEYIVQLRYEMDCDYKHFGYDTGDPFAVNCLTFAVGAAQVITGRSYADAFAGYTDPKSALRYMRSKGENLGDVLGLYFPEKPCAYVQRGDIVLVPALELTPFGEGCCIADPPHYWGLSEGGIGFGQLTEILRAFAVDSLPSQWEEKA